MISFCIFLSVLIASALSSKCYSQVSLNSPCSTNQDCLSGLYCEYNTKKCLAFPTLNSPCGNQVYCASNLGCSANNTCQLLATKGQVCMLGEFGYNICQNPLGCYSTTGDNQCNDLKGSLGAACTTENRCGGGLGCNFDNNGSTYCVTKRAAGGPCNNNDVCSNGYCDFTVLKCANKKAIGEVCKTGECQDGLSCVPTKYMLFLTRNTCQKIPSTVGAACNDICTAGLVCRP